MIQAACWPRSLEIRTASPTASGVTCALATAFEEWHSNVFPPPLCWDLDTTRAFDQASAHVTPEAVTESVRVSADLGRHAEWIAEYVELGFDQVYLHHVGKEQRPFLDAFGDRVLTQFDLERPGPVAAIDPPGPPEPRRPEQTPQPAVLP